MKKHFFVLLFSVCVVTPFFSSCVEESDEFIIGQMLNKLEYAINDNSYDDFKVCFHPDSGYETTYADEAAFLADFDDRTYTFDNRVIVINANTADITCDASIVPDSDPVSSEATVFVMKEYGYEWLILEWKEGGVDKI